MKAKLLLKKVLLSASFIIADFYLSHAICYAADITSAGSGSWNLSSTWAGNIVPQSGDNVFIRPGDKITVPENVSVNSITFLNTNVTKCTLVVNNGVVLNVAGGILLQNAADKNTDAVLEGSGKISCAFITIGSTITDPTKTCSATLTSTIAQLEIAGDLLIRSEVNSTFLGHSFFYLNSGTVVVKGSIVLDSDGTGSSKPVSGIDLSNGTGSGKLFIEGAVPFSIPGLGTTFIKLNGTGSTVAYSGNRDQPIWTTAYTNLTVSGSGTKTPSGTFTVNGKLTIDEGATWNQSSAIVTIPSTGALNVNGTLDFTSSAGQMSPSGGMTKLTMGPNGLIRTMNYGGLGKGSNTSFQRKSLSIDWDLTSISTNGTVEYYLNETDANGVITAQAITGIDYNHLIFSGSIRKQWSLGANYNINGDLKILSGASVLLSGNYILNIKGNLINDGADFNPGFTTTAFGGNQLQKIGGTSENNFYNLIINNASGVLLEQNANVGKMLTLNQGKLTIPVSKTLALTNSFLLQTIAGSPFDDTKHIVTQVNELGAKGILKVKNISANTSYLFPVGNGAHYLPVSISSSGLNEFSVTAFTGFTANGEPGTALEEAQRKHVVNVVWDVEGTYELPTEMSLSWPRNKNLEGSYVLQAIENNGSIGITQYKNGAWNTPSGTYQVTSNTVTVNRTNISSFSPFSVAVDDYVLPVHFSNVIAIEKPGGVEVAFTNLTESGINYYEIERSIGGQGFISIKRILPEKNDHGRASYTWLDPNATEGRIIYRIKAVEASGKVEYSDSAIVALRAKYSVLNVYALSGQVLIRISDLPEGNYVFHIVNTSGQLMCIENVSHAGGNFSHSLPLHKASKGVYIFQMQGPVQMQKKFLVQ